MFLARNNDRRKEGDDSPGERSRAQQAARVANVLAHRDDHVAHGLAWLGRLGVLDVETQKRLWERYQEGDQATRRLVQEQVARVLGTATPPADKGASAAEKVEPGEAGAGSLDPVEVDTLKRLSLPHVDPAAVAKQVRRFDPVRWFGEAKEPGPVMRFFSDAPLAVHHLQRRLLWTGVSLLVFVVALVALAVFVPAVVPWVGLAGIVIMALFFGVLLLRTAFWVDRTAKHQGIDLEVYAQLPDDERRILLMRRIGLRLFDPERISKAVESGLRQGLPLEMQAPPQRASSAETNPPVNEAVEPDVGPEPGDPREPVPAGGTKRETTVDPSDGAPDSEPPRAAAEGPGRMSRLFTETQDALQRAARSPAAKKAARQVAQRARSAGTTAREQFGELRQRGANELERTRQAVKKRRSAGASKQPAKRAKSAKKVMKKRTAGKRSGAAKKTVKRSTKKAAKKTRGRTGKKSPKKTSAKKQGAKKASARNSPRKGKKATNASSRKRRS